MVRSTRVEIERVSWSDTIRRMDWRQGEHITLIGPTGRGKTELSVELMRGIRWGIFFGTKRVNRLAPELKRMRFQTISDPAEINPQVHNRFLFWPSFPRASAGEIRAQHREVFRAALMRCFHQMGWTINVDEGRYIADYLGLKDELLLLWLQGREQGNAVICSTQRSRFIPLEAYDQATHLFIWSDPDVSNVKRNAELAGLDSRTLIASMRGMSKHDVIYANTITYEMFITNTRWETAGGRIAA